MEMMRGGMCFNKSYEDYIKYGLLIVTVLTMYLSKSNIRILNIFGLTFQCFGGYFPRYRKWR